MRRAGLFVAVGVAAASVGAIAASSDSARPAPSPAAVSAAPVVPLSVDDALSTNEFLVNGGAPAFSPDGSQIAYVLCDHARRAAVPDDAVTTLVATRGAAMYTLGCDIWVNATGAGSAPRSVSGAVGNNWSPAWSPDGQRIAFYSDRGGVPRLWVWEAKSGAVRQASDARVRTLTGTQRPIWLPDGQRLVVRLLPEGVTDDELDGDRVATTKKAPKAKSEPNASTVKVFESGRPPAEKTEAKAKTEGAGGPAKRMAADVGIVSLATGQVVRVAKGAHATNGTLSPDGASLLYATATGQMVAGTLTSPYDLTVVDIASGRARVVASNVLQYGGAAFSWSPDGQSIAYLDSTGVPAKRESLETGPGAEAWGRLFVVSAAAGATPKLLEPTEAIAGFDASSARPLWSAAGDAVFVIGDNRVWRGTPDEGRIAPLTPKTGLELAALVSRSDDRVWEPEGASAVVMVRDLATIRTGLYRVDARGTLTAAVDEAKKYEFREASPIASPDGRFVAYTAQSASSPAEIWLTTAKFDTPVRLTHANPQFDRYTFGEARLIDYRSADGQPLHAALLLPAGYEPGKRYPLITVVYASGMGSRDLAYFGLVNFGQYNFQLLATRGYAVLAPDIPVNVGTPMQDLMKGVMPAIDKAIEMGIADPDRLGLTGQSNGGYSTLALLVQTARFKAAVMNAGFGDLTGFYGAMSPDGSGSWHPWLEQKGGAMGVPPWEDPQRYVENSPIYYLDRLTTPLIIQAGAEDVSIVPFSDQVFVGLKRLNKPVTYLRYGGESHLLERHANQIDYWDRVLRFFDEHLKSASPGGTPPTTAAQMAPKP